VPKLNREQAISVAALALLILTCLFTVVLLLQGRADAGRELAERRELLSRLESRVRTGAAQVIAAAPPAAFLDAPTQGLASAQLQTYLAQLADSQHAGLLSSGGEAAKRDDAPDTIRLQATLDMNLQALRAMLYQLESGTPYVFVDALTMQPVSAAVGRAVEDPLLRATLSLRAEPRGGAVAGAAVGDDRSSAVFAEPPTAAIAGRSASRTAATANPAAESGSRRCRHGRGERPRGDSHRRREKNGARANWRRCRRLEGLSDRGPSAGGDAG
jgi:general secretion pathway protein M